MILYAAGSGVLAEIGDTINLVTISGSERFDEVTSIELVVDYWVRLHHHMGQ